MTILTSISVAHANATYVNLSSATLAFKIDEATTNLITTNDVWTNVTGVEGYFGRNLTATHGVDPQTVVTAEFASSALPSAGNTQVSANKGNPSAFNAGGLAEFDTGSELALGFQGNVQSNPYLVFYLNTVGVGVVYVSYTVRDIDSGSNDSVSPIALQYRVGETGNFINIPSAFIADATRGPNLSGHTNNISITLPAGALNQPKVQVRLIATNAAGADGNSTPDEWVGVNNIRLSALTPSAAGVRLGGRVRSAFGQPVGGAQVQISDGLGLVRTATSSPFGYYSFEDVPAGSTYFMTLRSKRFTFIPDYPAYTAYEDFDGLDFVGY